LRVWICSKVLEFRTQHVWSAAVRRDVGKRKISEGKKEVTNKQMQ
jgi:hypothetical protein